MYHVACIPLQESTRARGVGARFALCIPVSPCDESFGFYEVHKSMTMTLSLFAVTACTNAVLLSWICLEFLGSFS